MISNTYIGGFGEVTQWLSKLIEEKRSEPLIRDFKKIYHEVNDVQPLVTMSGLSQIYVDVADLPQMIPINTFSSGASRILLMMLAMAEFKTGVVLIDEVENGIFYKHYPLVWKTLVGLARDNDTQLFVSSHSLECLRASLPAIKDNEDDILLLRMKRERGSSEATKIEGKFVRAAIEEGFEIR
jgi:AAA15 family ATPase/GTPase